MSSTNICERAGTSSPYTHPPPPTQALPYPTRHAPTLTAHAAHAAHAARRGLRHTRSATRDCPGRPLQGCTPSARRPLAVRSPTTSEADPVQTRSPCPARRPLAVRTCAVRARSLPIFPCRYRHLQLFFSDVHFSCTECLTLPTTHCRLTPTTAATPQQRE